jgi:hypothetical protein
MLFEAPKLRMVRLRFELAPESPLHLPLEERGNVLRGAFGTVFRQTVCTPDCSGAVKCPRRETCAYAMLFEPGWRAGAARFGVGDAPRPFVFRPPLDPNPHFGRERPLFFELRLFGQAIEVAQFFIHAFQALALVGFQGRRVHLASVYSLDWDDTLDKALVLDGATTRNLPLILGFEELCGKRCLVGPLRIDFLTPTWLRHAGADQRVPSPEALIYRIRDRLSFLSLIYEGREWQADYGSIGKLARQIHLSYAEGGWAELSRRSTRTGQVMPMSGFVGTAIYENLPPALWPLLVVGQEIHVGRFAVWGNGAYSLVVEH